MKNLVKGKAGFTLVEIMIVVAIIGLLAAIALPNFISARTTTQGTTCNDQLRQIDGAKERVAFRNNLANGAVLNAAQLTELDGYLNGAVNVAGGVVCPATGTYTIAAVGTAVSCSLADAANNLHILQ